MKSGSLNEKCINFIWKNQVKLEQYLTLEKIQIVKQEIIWISVPSLFENIKKKKKKTTTKK